MFERIPNTPLDINQYFYYRLHEIPEYLKVELLAIFLQAVCSFHILRFLLFVKKPGKVFNN